MARATSGATWLIYYRSRELVSVPTLVVAEAQPGNPAAERWLLRLGFKPIEIAGQQAFVWRSAWPN